MIKVISIKNFQSHADSTLEFSDGVNAIIGPSDSGKTAIIRAIRWLVWNRPLGDEMRSNWGGDTSVEIVIDDKLCTRIRTNKINRYILGTDALSKALLFDAIRQDVPEEVQKALNMNEINLQMQLDSPFLLSNSPGEVGAHFNRIAHLDMIDIGTRNVQSWTRSIEQDIRSGEQYLHQQEEELKKYEHLDEFEHRLQVLETLEEQKISTAQRALNLSNLTADITEVEADINSHSALLKMEERVNGILGMMKELREIASKSEELGQTIDQIYQIDEDMERLQRITGNEDAINRLLELNSQRNELLEKRDAFYNLIEDAKYITKKYEGRKKLHIELQAQFDEAMPDVCPLCGRSG